MAVHDAGIYQICHIVGTSLVALSWSKQREHRKKEKILQGICGKRMLNLEALNLLIRNGISSDCRMYCHLSEVSSDASGLYHIDLY
jgi:hypothetical protein